MAGGVIKDDTLSVEPDTIILCVKHGDDDAGQTVKFHIVLPELPPEMKLFEGTDTPENAPELSREPENEAGV
jgi:hypothetical protein